MKKRILFVGGGTSGHIAPLLAVMGSLLKEGEKRGCELQFLYVGLKTDLESEMITRSVIPFQKYSISAGKLHRFLTVDQVIQGGRLLKGLVQARGLLKKLKPDAIFAKGGYVSVPIVLAAGRYDIPVFCHETDVLPGLANSLVARLAECIFTAFPAKRYATLPPDKVQMVGQPVREQFYTPLMSGELEVQGRVINNALPLVLVICGSQGSRKINELVYRGWGAILEKGQLVHIVGKTHFEKYNALRSALPSSQQERLWVVPFLTTEVPELFKRSTVVISRAGGTIAELAATRRSSILIPLPSAAQDHQRANATVLEDAEAAIVLEENNLSTASLVTTITNLLKDTGLRQKLARNIAQFDHPQAAGKMAEAILDTIC